MSVQLIVVSKRSEDIEFCQKIAARAKFDFASSNEPQHLEALLMKRPQNLVFFDIDSLEASQPQESLSLAKILPILSRYLKTRHLFGLADQSVFELPQVNQVGAIGHFCVRNYSEFAELWISKLCHPLFSPEPFGLDYYKDENVKVQTIELKAAREKIVAIEAIGNLLTRRKMNDRAIQMVSRVVDELLMNAFFDAPTANKGRIYRREMPRDEHFALQGKERVFLNLAFNEKFVNISVRDQFGSFVFAQALEAVRKDYSISSYQPDAKTKSAGLGLHGIAASGLSLMISCQPGVATEAVISFPYYQSFKETKNAFRSFSFNVKD